MKQQQKTKEGEALHKSQSLKKKLSLIEHIEVIIDEATNSKLSDKFYITVKPNTDYVGKALKLTEVQAVLISLFINNSDNMRIPLKDLSCKVNCSTVAMIRLMKEIDVLAKKKYIRRRGCDENYLFSVPNDFIEAVRKEVPYVPIQYVKLDKDSLFVSIGKVFGLREHHKSSYKTTIDDLRFIIENNQHLGFCKNINFHINAYDNLLILTAFCTLLVNGDDNMVGFHNFIYLSHSKIG